MSFCRYSGSRAERGGTGRYAEQGRRNDVNLDREARLLSENALRFNVASNLLRNEIRTMRKAIEEGEDEPVDPISISASGMAAQRARAETIVQNLANSETSTNPRGRAYRRKDVVFVGEPQGSPFSAVFQVEMQDSSMGVGVSEVLEDSRPPDMRYQPGHPHADARGYVAYPHISPAEEMVDLMGASSYRPMLPRCRRRKTCW